MSSSSLFSQDACPTHKHIPKSTFVSAPSLHAHLGCAVPNFLHLEYFSDHARLENMLFDRPLKLVNGHLVPDPSQPGTGIVLKRADAERFAA